MGEVVAPDHVDGPAGDPNAAAVVGRALADVLERPAEAQRVHPVAGPVLVGEREQLRVIAAVGDGGAGCPGQVQHSKPARARRCRPSSPAGESLAGGGVPPGRERRVCPRPHRRGGSEQLVPRRGRQPTFHAAFLHVNWHLNMTDRVPADPIQTPSEPLGRCFDRIVAPFGVHPGDAWSSLRAGIPTRSHEVV